jgi:ppGpp synthetase/RelA/SpoT-type nucleotidyltranferase
MGGLCKSYQERLPALRRAAQQLDVLLKETVGSIEDKALVRAEVRSIRVKELPSLQRKAESHGWKADEALWYCGDLVGGRVVCNNIEDVQRFAELLKERLSSPDAEFEVQDWSIHQTKVAIGHSTLISGST